MSLITCIIVDDEPLAVKLLESFVAKTPQLQLAHSFTDSVEALTWLKDHPVNLAFMDIQMPDLNGMELSHMLPEGVKVIFTTAFKEYAFESYEVNAVDFLLKPIRYNKFIAAVEKAEHLIGLEYRAESSESQPKKTIFIRVDGELRQVNFDNILYVEGMKDYVRFHVEGESVTFASISATRLSASPMPIARPSKPIVPGTADRCAVRRLVIRHRRIP